MRNERHPLMTLVGTSLLAALSGIELALGVPNHDVYQRLWDSLSPFVSSLEKVVSDVMSLDGKTIRDSGKEKALLLVSAWCHQNQMVFGQERMDAKSNEITAIPKVLDLLDLENKVITIGAMGAQREICQKIVDSKGDYVIALKGNQGTLYKDVKLYLEDAKNPEMTNENNDKGHGRLLSRTILHGYLFFSIRCCTAKRRCSQTLVYWESFIGH